MEVIIQPPTTEEARCAFSRQLAQIQAAAIGQALEQLDCPSRQKLALLEALIRQAETAATASG